MCRWASAEVVTMSHASSHRCNGWAKPVLERVTVLPTAAIGHVGRALREEARMKSTAVDRVSCAAWKCFLAQQVSNDAVT
jgi:hypothetical protein